MNDNKDVIILFLMVIIKNVVSLICFTILAIAFKKWWLSLFSILFWSSTSYSKGSDSNEQ